MAPKSINAEQNRKWRAWQGVGSVQGRYALIAAVTIGDLNAWMTRPPKADQDFLEEICRIDGVL